MGRIAIGILIGLFISSMTLNIHTDNCVDVREKLDKQGRKIDQRFRDRPTAHKKYERKTLFVGALVLFYGLISFLCIIKVIGDWQT